MLATKNLKFIYALIAVVCLIVFYPVLKANFIGYDDPYYILENKYIQEFSFKNIAGIFSGKAVDLYIPATFLFYMFEIMAFGTNPQAFHLVSVLLHCINVILLLNLLIKLDLKNNKLIAFLLVFFAINPLACESVCWISEQKDLLYTFFFFLSAIQFIDYQQTGFKKKILISFIYFLMACLSKPMAISLPFLLLIYVYCVDRKFNFKKFIYLIPFFLLSVIFAVISFYAIKNEAESKIPNYSALEKSLLLFSEIGYYFFKPFFPFYQQLINPFPDEHAVSNNTSIALFAIMGLFIFLLLLHNIFKTKNRIVTALIIAWIIFLTPILQIYPNTHSYVSERYFYVSMMFPVAITYFYLDKYLLFRKNQLYIFGALTLAFTVLTFIRSGYWNDTKTLFTQEVKVDENDARALNNLGYFYNSVQDYSTAEKFLYKAITIDSNNAVMLNNYGWSLSGLQLTDSAIVVFRKSLTKKSNFVRAINNLGICYATKNNWSMAYFYFAKSYDLDPLDPETLYYLGLYYLSGGGKDTSREYMKKSYELGYKAAEKYLH